MFYSCTPHTHCVSFFRFVTYLKDLTHHCFSEERVRWPSLSSCTLKNCCILIYNPILGLLPSYPLTFTKQKSAAHHNLWSQDIFLAASSTWNKLQKDKKLNEPVLLDVLRTMLNDLSDLSFRSGSQCWEIFALFACFVHFNVLLYIIPVCMVGCLLSVENILIVLLPVLAGTPLRERFLNSTRFSFLIK